VRISNSDNRLPADRLVSRGQKATFHNPPYRLSPEVIEASKLPIDHPDFEVAEACAPHVNSLPVVHRHGDDVLASPSPARKGLSGESRVGHIVLALEFEGDDEGRTCREA
jgi:hypothetical protein